MEIIEHNIAIISLLKMIIYIIYNATTGELKSTAQVNRQYKSEGIFAELFTFQLVAKYQFNLQLNQQ